MDWGGIDPMEADEISHHMIEAQRHRGFFSGVLKNAMTTQHGAIEKPRLQGLPIFPGCPQPAFFLCLVFLNS